MGSNSTASTAYERWLDELVRALEREGMSPGHAARYQHVPLSRTARRYYVDGLTPEEAAQAELFSGAYS